MKFEDVRVGDVLFYHPSPYVCYVVTCVDGDKIHILWRDGSCGSIDEDCWITCHSSDTLISRNKTVTVTVSND
jgi:hypothetical protein